MKFREYMMNEGDDKKSVFYRCGWCGHPTDKDGKRIHENDPDQYIEQMQSAGSKEEQVPGDCCREQAEAQENQISSDRMADGEGVHW